MARAEKEYRRLPGRGKSLTTVASLWLGRDHLLHLESTGFSESYKRYYYRDIQAFLIRKTATGRISNVVFGVLAAPFAAGVFLADDGLQIFLGIMLGLVSALLLVNLALGATCVCHLRTAVQVEKLGSLTRLRKARKTLRLIRPQIESFQGTLSPEESAAAMQQWMQPAAAPAPAAATAPVVSEISNPADPAPPPSADV